MVTSVHRLSIKWPLQWLSCSKDCSASVLYIEPGPSSTHFSQGLRRDEHWGRRRPQRGSLGHSMLDGIFDGLVTRGGERSMDGSSSVSLVDASSMWHGRYSSMGLSNISPKVSGIETMSPVLDSTDLTILFAFVFFWTRLRILVLNSVGVRLD